MATEVDRRWGRGWRRPRPKERKKAIFDPIHKRPFFCRPRSRAAPGGAYKGTSLRVCVAPQLCGPAAARPRRFRFVGPAAVRPLDPCQFPVLLLLSVGRYCSSATGPPTRGPKRNPYNVFGPRGHILATPTTFSGPWGGIFVTPTTFSGPGGAFMRPLQRVRPRGGGLF